MDTTHECLQAGINTHNMKNKAILIISILGVLLSIILSGIYLNFSYFEPDTVSYLFQAKLFAEGKISMPEPPEYGFSSSPHINILNGKWYSKYPFGNALMLMFGVFVNAPWLIPALATGGALFLLFLLVRETYGKPIALVAAVIALISPATAGMGSTWFSEPVSRFYLTLYLFALVRTLNGAGNIIYPLLSGFALGYAFNTRPLSAIVFGVVGAGFALYHLYKPKMTGEFSETEAQNQNNPPTRKQLISRLGIFLIPFAVMIFVCMAWNHHFTGNPFTFTHTAAQPYDKIGFGKRTEGYEPNLEHAFDFKPEWAIERTWRHILPCISFNAFGWGNYHHRILEKPKVSLRFIIDFLPLLLPWFFILIPFFHASRNRYDVLCIAFIVGSLLLYAFFYFEGSTWGFTPVNARYYTEAIFLGFIPLAAKGMFILYERFKLPQRRGLSIAVGVCLLLLSVNTVWSFVRIGKVYQNWGHVYQKLPPMVAEENIHNAVIFVSRHRGAPIGDYPFKSLEEADIIYFKLGPAPRWRLTNSDWKAVYAEYFANSGREAYLYEPGQNELKSLSLDP
ncbi:MAG: hypothetical protein OXI43_00875 [Candidatus Poribacteria bacterium]|nr:hypothetical protein [Candidatus Poribacteria bacterium]